MCVNPRKKEEKPPRNFKLTYFKFLMFRDLPLGLLVAGLILLVEQFKHRKADGPLFRPTDRRITRYTEACRPIRN